MEEIKVLFLSVRESIFGAQVIVPACKADDIRKACWAIAKIMTIEMTSGLVREVHVPKDQNYAFVVERLARVHNT